MDKPASIKQALLKQAKAWEKKAREHEERGIAILSRDLCVHTRRPTLPGPVTLYAALTKRADADECRARAETCRVAAEMVG